MEAFWSGWWWPAATAVLGFTFSWLVFAQWLKRRKPHQLAWAAGMLFYAIAAVMETVSESTGSWNPIVYRFYIVFAASLVGFLGLGSYYLLARKKTGPRIYLAFLIACLVIFLVGVMLTPLDTEMLQPGITVGGQALGSPGSFPRIMSLPFNITGSFFLLGGALWSIWRFARKQEFAYRMWANVLIAIGTIVIAAAGGMARAGITAGLYPGEMLASAILLAGFLMAGTLDKGAKEAVARDRHRREHEAAARADEYQRPPDLPER
jgi:hypothetical protein